MANIEEKVEALLTNIIKDLNYKIYDIEYAKEGKDYYLRVFIDSEAGIGLEDCEKVSNAISDILDEANYIKEQYFLEVSSPGIERVLRKDKHLDENIGENIEIKLYKPINKEKQYIGILKGYDSENIFLENVTIERKNISQIKTIYNWE
jgi:ribosome maturation factor RimP